MTRIFHFVLNETLYDDLVNLAGKLEMSLSSSIKYIMNHCYLFLEKKHFLGVKKDFNMTVDWSRHILVYFEGDTRKYYDLLKAIHHNLDSYSMAQILRLAIEYFIEGTRRCGSVDSFLEELEDIYSDWIDYRRQRPRIRFHQRPIQLYRHNNDKYVMTYNDGFQLMETIPLLE